MDPHSPPRRTSGTGAQQLQVPPINRVHDNPDGSTGPGWQSTTWGPNPLRPSAFATGGNGIRITPRTPPQHELSGLHAGPGGGTIHPQRRSQISHSQSRGEETWNLPPGDVRIVDNGVPFERGTALGTEGQTRVPPKPGRGGFCEKCPDFPSFPSKAAFKKHKRELHVSSVPKCPMCPARIPKQLTRHLKKVHGITGAAVEVSSLTVPASMAYADGIMEPLRGSQGAAEIVSHTNEAILGRFYCQEYDCGRGFSSKVHLESHMRVFHLEQPEQIAKVQGETPSSSREVVGPSAERSPEWYLSKPTITSPHVGERMAQESHGPYPSIRTRVPSLSVGDRQDIDSSAENAGTRHEIPTESTTQGHVNAQSKTETPTTSILSLHCRMCEAPPTATTQPTATTCGHLFCSECITQHVVSMSRCPVCNSSILLYCLFKLDLPVTS